jgi:hypothetical protein
MTEAKVMIASAMLIPVRVIKALLKAYDIPDPLPWSQIAGPLSLSVTDFNLQRLAENRRPLFRLRFQQDPDSALTHLAFRSWTAQSSQLPS